MTQPQKVESRQEELKKTLFEIISQIHEPTEFQLKREVDVIVSVCDSHYAECIQPATGSDVVRELEEIRFNFYPEEVTYRKLTQLIQKLKG